MNSGTCTSIDNSTPEETNKTKITITQHPWNLMPLARNMMLEKSKRCREKNLCFNCEKPGHQANWCPDKKWWHHIQAMTAHDNNEPKQYLRATRTQEDVEKIIHKALHYTECPAHQQKVGSCPWHYQQQMVDFRDMDHPWHTEYPIFTYEYFHHCIEQEKHIHKAINNPYHPSHGYWGCEVDNCSVCVTEEDKEEYYNMMAFQGENNLSHPDYSKLSWMACYNENCLIHESDKLGSRWNL